MNIEFNIYKLKTDSDTYKRWSKQKGMQPVLDQDFIVVGEELLGDKPHLQTLDIGEKGLCLIGGLMLNEATYLIPEGDLQRTSFVEEYDIPKQHLTMEIVEGIQRINERLCL